jgi:hypothetical protein
MKTLHYIIGLVLLYSTSLYAEIAPVQNKNCGSYKNTSNHPNPVMCDYHIEMMKSFVDDLTNENIDKVVARIKFPLFFWGSGKKVGTLTNSDQLKNHYDLVFPKHIIKKLHTSFVNDREYFWNWKGMMFGSGDVWFNKESGKVIAINQFDENLIKQMVDEPKKVKKELTPWERCCANDIDLSPLYKSKNKTSGKIVTTDGIMSALYFRIPSSLGQQFKYFECAKTMEDILKAIQEDSGSDFQVEKTETTLRITTDGWFYGFDITGENQVTFRDDALHGTYLTVSQLQLQYDEDTQFWFVVSETTEFPNSPDKPTSSLYQVDHKKKELQELVAQCSSQ